LCEKYISPAFHTLGSLSAGILFPHLSLDLALSDWVPLEVLRHEDLALGEGGALLAGVSAL